MKKVLMCLLIAILSISLFACDQIEDDLTIGELTAGDQISITFWHIWGKDKSAVLANMVEEFENYMLDKYGVEVTITSTSQSNYTTLLDKTNKAIASGDKSSMPNLVVGYPDHFAGYLKSKAVVNLDLFIDAPIFGIDREDILAPYLAENNQFGGRTYSLPFSKSGEIMIYNKSATDACNLEIPYNRPLTWTEMEEYWAVLKNYKENYCNFKYCACYDSTDNLFINFSRQLNAKYTESSSYREGQLLVTDTSTQSMIMKFATMVESKVLSTPQNYAETASYGSDYFQQQAMAFTIGSTAGVSYNIPTATSSKVKYIFEGGVAMVPQFETGVDGNEATKSVVQQGPNIAMLNTGTAEEKLVAWLFIKYMLTMDQYSKNHKDANEEGFVEGMNNNARFAYESHYFPVTHTAIDSAFYQNFLSIAEKYYNGQELTAKEKEDLLFSQVAYVSLLQSDWYKYDPAFAASKTLLGSASIREAAGSVIEKIALDTKYDPETALQEMYDACKIG